MRTVEGEILYWTQGAEELYGFKLDEAVGRISHELFKTEFPIPPEEINRALMDRGLWNGLLRHTKKDGATLWVESRWRLRPRSDGEGPIVVESNTDVTQRENLSRELDHRVKNTLMVVQGLARMKLKGCEPEAMKMFEDQLATLAQAHTILLQHHWGDASLTEVLERALQTLGVRDRVRLAGEDARLRPSSVIAYTLAFHELATNALKHGSLSTPDGWVEVTWEVFGPSQEKVHLLWREHGGPAPSQSPSPGAGARLLQKVVSAELGVPVKLRFEQDGLVCEFDGATQKSPHFGGEAA